jgi:uracil-DNA glycosylase
MQFDKQFWIDTLGKGWALQLKELLRTEYGKSKLMGFLTTEYAMNPIRPAKSDVFNAFKLCPWESVRVVIIGQKPHNTIYGANGLAYGDKLCSQFYSPTIGMIYDQIEREYYNGLCLDFDFSLEEWAKQGVLLLNKQLTIREKDRGEHTRPWGKFVSAVLNALVENKTGIIYILWGEHRKLAPALEKNNYVLTFDHPSDYVYPKKDWHCPNFKETNEILMKMNGEKINW